MENLKPETRAGVLVEALPYLQDYYGKIVVVKYGGNAMINEELKQAVIRDIVLLNLVGIKVVLVHGGGPEIGELLKKTGKESKFIKGLRYTDQETMEAVQMVLCGKLNKNLVTLLKNAGGKGVGLSGMDGGLFEAVKLNDPDGTEYGYVGDIVKTNPQIVLDMLEKGYIPVVTCVAAGIDDTCNYNINAEEKLAIALKAKKLIMLTAVRGLLRDPSDDTTLIKRLKVSDVPSLVKEGVIKGGMIPKVNCCVECVRQGVERANIQDGRVPHSILIELLTNEGVGTMFS